MGDKIGNLPTDTKSSMNKSDMNIISNLFKNDNSSDSIESKSTDKNGPNKFKDSIIGGILFVILSSQIVDKTIRSFGCHEALILGVKFLLFIVIYFITKNRV